MTDNFNQKTKLNLSLSNLIGQSRSSFTLIELLVVLALVAILSVVVVMTLNPAELLKQARDSNRLSDIATINTALNLFSADVTSGFMGTSTVVYVSLPDNSSSTCGSWGLPALPAGYTYNCVSTANLRNTNGTGWIPVNFQRISSNSPISQLPIDPQNTTSTGNYYTYVSGGSWILTAIPESAKQKAELSTSPHIQNYPGVIGMGNNLNLSPLYNPNGLAGYWKFDEGSGTVARDSSGNGNDTVFSGGSSYFTTQKVVGSYAGYFDGGTVAQVSSLTSMPTGDMSISAWINRDSGAGYRTILATNQFRFTTQSNHAPEWSWNNGGGYAGGGDVGSGRFRFVTAVKGAGILSIYIDGLFVSSGAAVGATNTTGMSIGYDDRSSIGGPDPFFGQIDDVRVYSRALSAAEVLALYNATR